MNREAPMGEALLADQAYDRLIAVLRDGTLASGQFVSMPGLVELLELPLAATREAVKRADVNGLVRVLPKRGVLVMDASAKVTRDCMDLRALLDAEGARRLIATRTALPLDALRASHSGADRGRGAGDDARSAAARDPDRPVAARRALDRPRQPAGGDGLRGQPRPYRGDPEHPAVPARPHRAGDAASTWRSSTRSRGATPRRRSPRSTRTTARRCGGGGSSSRETPRLSCPGTARRRGSAGCRTAVRARPSRGRRCRWCGW